MTIPDIKPFAGAFLMSPIPLELSLNWCSYACIYCFANLNTPTRRATLTQLLNFLADYHERETLEAHLLQQGYPVCISNTVDLFAPSNYHQARPLLEILGDLGIPVQPQTRGTDRPAWRDAVLDLVEQPAVWYLSLSTLDEGVRQRLEPKAPTIGSRIDLMRRLTERGHTVVIGFNPAVEEWCPDPVPLIETCIQAGARGFWVERLHLNAAQIEAMPVRDRTTLGGDLLARARRRQPTDADRAYFDAVRAAITERGVPVYSYNQPTPSSFFDLYRQVYRGKVFPTHQDFVNRCHQHGPRLLTFADYARVLLPHLPAGTWAIDQYIGATAASIWKRVRVPGTLTYRDLLAIGWQFHEPKFSPVRLPCFAWAAQWSDAQGGWLRYVDADGLPVLAFQPDREMDCFVNGIVT